MQNNSRWKTLQSRNELLGFLRKNPEMAVFDTREKEKRFVVRRDLQTLSGITVDGRSFRATYFSLTERADGGFSLSNPSAASEGESNG